MRFVALALFDFLRVGFALGTYVETRTSSQGRFALYCNFIPCYECCIVVVLVQYYLSSGRNASSYGYI